MIRRFRMLAALLALTALSANFAENVWAAMCMPDADGAAEMAGMHAEHAGMAHSMPDQPGEAPAPEPDRCPLIMAGASCIAFSLPAPVVRLEAPGDVGSSIALAPRAAVNLLLVVPVFRPPIA